MAPATTAVRKKSTKKLRVVEFTAPKRLRAQARQVKVVALKQGYYNHMRIGKGDTFNMLVIGDEADQLPLWTAYAGSKAADKAIRQAMGGLPGSLPSGVTASKVAFRDAHQPRDLTVSTDDDDDDDDDDGGSESGNAGGGGGKDDDDVL